VSPNLNLNLNDLPHFQGGLPRSSRRSPGAVNQAEPNSVYGIPDLSRRESRV